MSEIQRILRMLERGDISADVAERLIKAVRGAGVPGDPGPAADSGSGPDEVSDRADEAASGPGRGQGAGAGPADEAPAPVATGAAGTPAFLRVQIDPPTGTGRDRMDVRIPLALVRAGPGWQAMMPAQARAALADRLGLAAESPTSTGLDPEALIAALADLHIDIQEGGSRIRVFAE